MNFLDQFRHLATNKDFINRLAEGEFEVVHPFQIRDKNDRIGIDTRLFFFISVSDFAFRMCTKVLLQESLFKWECSLQTGYNCYS